MRKKSEFARSRSRSHSFSCGLSCPAFWHKKRENQRPPEYERQMWVSMGLHRFVSVCTSLFCSRIIVKDYNDLYTYGGNTGTKTGTKIEKSEYISPEFLRSGKTYLKLSGCRVQQLVEIKIIPVKTSELIAYSLPSGVYRILMRLTRRVLQQSNFT